MRAACQEVGLGSREIVSVYDASILHSAVAYPAAFLKKDNSSPWNNFNHKEAVVPLRNLSMKLHLFSKSMNDGHCECRNA